MINLTKRQFSIISIDILIQLIEKRKRKNLENVSQDDCSAIIILVGRRTRINFVA